MKKTIPIIVLAVLVASCVSTGKGNLTGKQLAARYCDVFTQLTYDGRVDTPETKAQIKRHNAQIKAFCNQ
jgi:hypothetical protein